MNNYPWPQESNKTLKEKRKKNRFQYERNEHVATFSVWVLDCLFMVVYCRGYKYERNKHKGSFQFKVIYDPLE